MLDDVAQEMRAIQPPVLAPGVAAQQPGALAGGDQDD
jgi:hypothetical protein